MIAPDIVGRGQKLGRAVIIVAGVASLVASILSFM